MSVKERVGGRAYTNGVRLMNSRRSVRAYYDRQGFLQFEVSTLKRGKYLELIAKIPILRGIVSLALALWMFFKEVKQRPRKYWFIILIFLADLIIIFLPAGGEEGGSITTIFLIFYYSLPFLLLVIFRSVIGEVLKYHGAEHKVVHYYENDCQGEAADYSRLHRRCGSNLVFYYLLISLITALLFPQLNGFWLEVIWLGLAYELIRYTPDRLIFIPYLFQRLVTREPEERHLKAALKALEVLIVDQQ